jgi:hypothetical protein
MTQINISDLQVANSDFTELSDLEREAIIGGTKPKSSFGCAPKAAPAPVCPPPAPVCAPPAPYHPGNSGCGYDGYSAG